MDKRLRQRRQLLLYLGLGLVSGGTGLGLKSRTATSTGAIATARSPSSADSTQIALNQGRALPEFQGISQWLNSSPLTITELKGKVILVQFWTFACINCQRTLPALTGWHRQYAAQGLTVIGVHTPEFAFERDINNIKQAIQQYQIGYSVPVDNNYQTWKAYDNQYWPHLFLADRQGFVRYDHIGEGAYDQTEQTIRKLLG